MALVLCGHEHQGSSPYKPLQAKVHTCGQTSCRGSASLEYGWSICMWVGWWGGGGLTIVLFPEVNGF